MNDGRETLKKILKKSFVCVCVGEWGGGDITYQERSLWLLFRFLRDIHKHPACLVSQQHHYIIKKTTAH